MYTVLHHSFACWPFQVGSPPFAVKLIPQFATVANHDVENKFFDVMVKFMKFLIAQPKDTFAGHAFDLEFTLEKILSLDIKLFDKHPEIYLVFTYGLDDDHFNDEEMPEQLDDTMINVTFVCSPNNDKKLKKSQLDCFDTEWVVSKKAREVELASS